MYKYKYTYVRRATGCNNACTCVHVLIKVGTINYHYDNFFSFLSRFPLPSVYVIGIGSSSDDSYVQYFEPYNITYLVGARPWLLYKHNNSDCM